MPTPTTSSDVFAQRLLTGAGVAALVGTRVYPSKPAQDVAEDYVVYFRTGGGDAKTLGGRSGLQPSDIRVECYASTQAAAEAILKAVTTRLCGDRAAGVPGWRDRANGVHGCFAQGDSDEQVLDDGGQVSGQTFSLWFKPQA